MRARIIAFVNEKGGVGKSSICFNCGWELAQGKRKVLFVDMDSQRANLTFFCGIEKTNTTMTLYNVLVDKTPVKETVLQVEERLQVIPATSDVASMNEENTNLSDMVAAMEELRPHYDFIFVDVNPTPNRSHALALAVADYVIVPMLPDVTSLEANMGVIESVKLVRQGINPKLVVMGIVFNKYTWRTRLSREVTATAEKMAKALGTRVFKTKVRNNVSMSENIGHNEGITTYEPSSSGADDIRALCREIIKEVKANEQE